MLLPDGAGRGDAALAASEAASGAGLPGEGLRGSKEREGRSGRLFLGSWGRNGGSGTLHRPTNAPGLDVWGLLASRKLGW